MLVCPGAQWPPDGEVDRTEVMTEPGGKTDLIPTRTDSIKIAGLILKSRRPAPSTPYLILHHDGPHFEITATLRIELPPSRTYDHEKKG